MSNPIEAQIKERIASFVAELDLMVRKSTLESLQAVLSNTKAPSRRGRPAGSKRGPGRPRRSGNVDEAAAKIVAHVRANDAQGISAIADATGVDLKTAKKAAIKLLAEGTLKKSGAKRGTVYHVGSGRPARAKKARKAAGKRKAAKAKRKPAVIIPHRRRAKPAAAKRAAKPAVVKPAARRRVAKRAPPAPVEPQPLSVVAPG